jgi:hypothetical protein
MSCLRPVNDHEIQAILAKRMAGYGNGERTAIELDVESNQLREMRSGRRGPSPKVASKLGYELKWVKRS